MAVWPWKSRARRQSEAAAQEVLSSPNVFGQPVNHSTTALPPRRMSKGSIQSPWRRGSLAKGDDEKLLQPSSLGPIFSVSPLDSEFKHRPQTPDSQASAEDITALPISKVLKTSPHLRPTQKDTADIPYDFRLHSSHSRLETSNTTPSRYQSLRKLSRSGSKFGRSTRADSQQQDVREEELRAMSYTTVPRAPTRGDSGILRRESKKVRSGLNMNLQRPESNISLPQHDSAIGSLMRQPDARSYRISIMDIMSPRPIIKSSEPHSMIALGVTDSRAPSRRQMTATGTESGKKSRRIHDLADNLDSAGLRAAMERDQRRREKKKEADAEKLRRRLLRRAEKQRAEESGEEAYSNPFDDIVQAATVAAARTPSRRRAQLHGRRRSSSASRDERILTPSDDPDNAAPPPIPSRSESRALGANTPDRHLWPKRIDSRKPAPAIIAKRSQTLRNETSFETAHTSHSVPEDSAAEQSKANHGLLVTSGEINHVVVDRIVPEEDPDDAEPPVIARRRHPAHEMPHVAHLYARQAPSSPPVDRELPGFGMSGTHSPAALSFGKEQVPDRDTINEPVLDFTAVEIPDTFAPSEIAENHRTRPSPAEEKAADRASPLLPTGGEDIPGLPFLSSVGSDSDNSPIVSPFAASFPSSFPDVDFAAPAPTVHRDMREARYSGLSSGRADDHYASGSSITALPQVPAKAEPESEKRKRKRGPSLLLSFFRRGDKRAGARARAISDSAATTPVSSGFEHDFPGQKFTGIVKQEAKRTGTSGSQFQSESKSPVRSHSRFKEDLSGSKIRGTNSRRPPSPPESRINSPYDQVTPTSPEFLRGALITPLSHPRFSAQSAYGAKREDNVRRSKSLNRESNMPSKSMASIDSEGSWLTGKPVRGLSTRSARLRNLGNNLDQTTFGVQSHARHRRTRSGYSSASDENQEPLMAEDHFGLRPTTTENRSLANEVDYRDIYTDERSLDSGHMASSEIITRAITRDGPEEAHGSARLSTELVAKQPSVNKGVRVKSSEGLFKGYLTTRQTHDAASVTDDATSTAKDVSIYEDTSQDPSPSEKTEVELLRAMSVRAPQRVHKREGSGAKLIEVQSKRASIEPSKDIAQ